MLSENVKLMNYSRSVPGTIVLPREREAEVDSLPFFYEVVTALFLLLIPLLMMYMLRGLNVQTEYEVQNLRLEVVTLSKENSISSLDVMKLESPARIQELAETKLGMVVPTYVVSPDTRKKGL